MPAEGLALRARAGLTQFDQSVLTLGVPGNGVNTLLSLVLVTNVVTFKVLFTVFVRDTVTGAGVVHQARVIVQGGAVPVMIAAPVEFSSSNIGAFTPLWAQGVGGLFAFVSAINPIGANPVNYDAHVTIEDGP